MPDLSNYVPRSEFQKVKEELRVTKKKKNQEIASLQQEKSSLLQKIQSLQEKIQEVFFFFPSLFFNSSLAKKYTTCKLPRPWWFQ